MLSRKSINKLWIFSENLFSDSLICSLWLTIMTMCGQKQHLEMGRELVFLVPGFEVLKGLVFLFSGYNVGNQVFVLLWDGL